MKHPQKRPQNIVNFEPERKTTSVLDPRSRHCNEYPFLESVVLTTGACFLLVLTVLLAVLLFSLFCR